MNIPGDSAINHGPAAFAERETHCCPKGVGIARANFECAAFYVWRATKMVLRQLEMDLVASIWGVTEGIMVTMAHHAREVAGSSVLCPAGTVLLLERIEDQNAQWARYFPEG